MMSRSVKNVSKPSRCIDDPGVLEPKKLILIGVAMFIIGMFVGRMFNALQLAGLAGSVNVVNGFHFHHWMYSLIALVVLFPLAFYFRVRNRAIFAITVILIFFFTGLFVDGIVYPDSFIFYE